MMIISPEKVAIDLIYQLTDLSVTTLSRLMRPSVKQWRESLVSSAASWLTRPGN